MKKYESPVLIKVKLDPQEAYNTSYGNCILGEGYSVEYGTGCTSEYYQWFDAGDYQCYMTPGL